MIKKTVKMEEKVAKKKKKKVTDPTGGKSDPGIFLSEYTAAVRTWHIGSEEAGRCSRVGAHP